MSRGSRPARILIRGHQITAQRCYEIGLANHVVPSDDVMRVAREIAEEIAALPPRHVQVTKEQLLMARPRLSQYQSAVELKKAQDYLYALEDTKEAAVAFAEKRTAGLPRPLAAPLGRVRWPPLR